MGEALLVDGFPVLCVVFILALLAPDWVVLCVCNNMFVLYLFFARNNSSSTNMFLLLGIAIIILYEIYVEHIYIITNILVRPKNKICNNS